MESRLNRPFLKPESHYAPFTFLFGTSFRDSVVKPESEHRGILPIIPPNRIITMDILSCAMVRGLLELIVV